MPNLRHIASHAHSAATVHAAAMLLLGGMTLWCDAEPTQVLDTQPTWQAPRSAVEDYVARFPELIFREIEVPDFVVPPIASSNELDIDSWRTRRQELLRLFEDHVYGRILPPPDTVSIEQLHSTAIPQLRGISKNEFRITAVMKGDTFQFPFVLYCGQQRAQPLIVFINNRSQQRTLPNANEESEFLPFQTIVRRGYAVAIFQHSDVAPDNKNDFRDGILNLVLPDGPRAPNASGALAAWAWGAGRVLDALDDLSLVDTTKAAVIGHSRGGKAALLAGMIDQRFQLVISNNSGCGGAALSRRTYGEDVRRITDAVGYWFCPHFADFANREESLPVDQHQAMALIAPRALHVASADEDVWADPRGEWLSLTLASPAYQIFGFNSLNPQDVMPPPDTYLFRGPTAYHIRRGPHELTKQDWLHYLDTADRVFASKE